MRITLMFGVLSFLNLVMALASYKWLTSLQSVLVNASTKTNTYTQLSPLLSTINYIFWLLFIFSLVSTVIFYILGSHQEEYEQYITE